MAIAAISPTMNTTIINSTSVKPVGAKPGPRRTEGAARTELLLDVPIPDVGIGSFATFLAVGAPRVQVVLLPMRAGEDVLVRIAPGILAHALDVTAFAPVAHRGIVRSL